MNIENCVIQLGELSKKGILIYFLYHAAFIQVSSDILMKFQSTYELRILSQLIFI